jgi:peptidoglycan-N-acetylglucosamine deacetylase
MNRKINIFALFLMLFAASSCGNKENKTETGSDTTKTASVSKPTPGSPITLDPNKRYIFLTWDDSPQPPGTAICYNVFKEEGVKASFFSVGMHYDIEPRRRRIIDTIRNGYPQFLLANHSYSHGFRDNYNTFYKLVDSAITDFQKAEKTMNIPVKIIRLPGRNSWAINGSVSGPKTSENVARRLDSLGYKVVGWDIEWGFIKGSTPKESPTQIMNLINSKFEAEYTQEPNALVILAHDRMFAKQPYTDSLRKLISLIKADGRYVFETIDHYPGIGKK